MSALSRVVWSEGMYLGPHHFQAQNRYFENAVHFATSALWFGNWGFAACELNREALRNGTVSILHARGLFSDGLAFLMPECDPLPPARQIAGIFPPTREKLTILLAVPPLREDRANCALSPSVNGHATRFIAETDSVQDELTGRDEKPVRLGRKNLMLLLDTEAVQDHVVLPLARIMRSGTGEFIQDPDFIPPCLQISSSERLLGMLTHLIEIMEEKAASLARPPNGGQTGLSERDIANLWFLHTVNASLAPLRHLAGVKRGHPEELFAEMSRLAGALCTFRLDSDPRSLPVYNHADPEPCFDALNRHIREHLDTIVPANCTEITLAKHDKYFHFGEVTDQRTLGPARWILGIRASVGEAELMARAPELIKFCSQAFVPELVKRAMPGLTLTHLAVPPTAISARVETQYFSVNRAGPCWDHLVKTRRVGIYVPGDLPDPELDLFVVFDG